MKEFWQNLNASDAGDAILTGYVGDFKDMPVYKEVIDLCIPKDNSRLYALDFGCGVGRNSVALSILYDRVMAFDLPNMISLVPQENKLSNIVYTSKWDKIKTIKYNLVLASLVFQHIHDDELNKYLSELQTEKLVLHSRTWMDDTGTKVLTVVEKYFIIENMQEVQDPNSPINDHFIAVMRKKNA